MKVVLITGSSTGIGLETAPRLADQGCRVFASACNPAASEGLRAAKEVLETVKRAVAETLERVGRIDVLENHAGETLRADLYRQPANNLEGAQQ